MRVSVPQTIVELQPCRSVLTLESNVDKRLGPLTVLKDGAFPRKAASNHMRAVAALRLSNTVIWAVDL